MKDKIVYVVNVDWFFLSHRLPLALAAIDKGFDVYLLCRNTGRFQELIDLGIKPIDIKFARSGFKVIDELKIVFKLIKLFRELNPIIIHSITLKVCLIVSICIKFNPKVKLVNAISGLGHIFTSGSKYIRIIIAFVIKFMFKGDNLRFIFQNSDDHDYFNQLGLISNNFIITKGSGINLNIYNNSLEPGRLPIVYLIACRMLKDKGVLEFAKAFGKLRSEYGDSVKAIMAGPIDLENPAALKVDEIKILELKYGVEWIGESKEMQKLILNSHVAVLPSYREGFPKFLIEASAIGRPIITTDTVGCRDCVVPGYNGILVSVKNVDELYKAMKLLFENSNMRSFMGSNSRIIAEENYDISEVVNRTFDIYSH